MNLIIVESPAKARTIEGYLGSNYRVVASYGHIRDLPKSKLGIDKETLEPEYIIPVKSKKYASLLKKEKLGAEKIILATDEDREGEAIAWHISRALEVDENDLERITFHEITKEAILSSVKNPRKLDYNLIDAQQARRVLDRLVGYNLSPLLWKKIRRGLSAGRVQSVALKLIIDREKEIRGFQKEEYWEIVVDLLPQKSANDQTFEAKLIKGPDGKIETKNNEEAKKVTDYLKEQSFIISEVAKYEKKRNPYPPFITSTLQQEASQKLGFPAKKTMMIAQKLYEGVNLPQEGSVGLITYMRTDSVRVSGQIISEARSYIEKFFGKAYLPERPNYYKSKKSAQEAHEAIRPTSIKRDPKNLEGVLEDDQRKLYSLIWRRTVASQMKPEILDLSRVDIAAGKYVFRANGKQVKFDGFSSVYLAGTKKEQAKANKEALLPELKEGEKCKTKAITPLQKFTQPKDRFTEASLVKVLEENGIGRPSTYDPIISTLKDRGYVVSEKRVLIPQEIGFLVNDMLSEHFSEIVDVGFTAKIEEDLDIVATGDKKWKDIVSPFWNQLSEKIEKKGKEIAKINTDKETDLVCEICGKMLLIKEGRFGKFYACSGFPECKNTKPYIEKTDLKCPECKNGDVVIKKTKSKRSFWGCSNYPNCKWASWKKPESKQKINQDKN